MMNRLVRFLDSIGKAERPPAVARPGANALHGFLVVAAILGLFMGLCGIAFAAYQFRRSANTTEKLLEISLNTFKSQLTDLGVQGHKVVLADLTGDKIEEIAIGYRETSADSGIIRIFSASGPILCEVQTFKRYDSGLDIYRSKTSIATMGVADFDGDGYLEIFAIANDVGWKLARVVIVDGRTCKIVRDYVHSGQLHSIKAVRLGLLSWDLLLIIGNNNEYSLLPNKEWWNIALLDPQKLAGQGPPGFLRETETGNVMEFSRPAHLWYFLLAPPGIGLTSDVRILDVDGTGSLDVLIADACGNQYFIDLHGNSYGLEVGSRSGCGNLVELVPGLVKVNLDLERPPPGRSGLFGRDAACLVRLQEGGSPGMPWAEGTPLMDC